MIIIVVSRLEVIGGQNTSSYFLLLKRYHKKS